MKTIRLSLLAAALVGTAALLTAGPNYLPGRPAPKDSAATKPAAETPAKVVTNDRGPAHEVKAPAAQHDTATAATCAACACCKKAS